MREILTNALHLFIIFMMAVFVIGGILAVTGSFDHWGDRYRLKRRRRRLLRGRPDNNNTTINGNTKAPLKSADTKDTNIKNDGRVYYSRTNAA